MSAIQCRDCVTGALHTETPTGTETKVHGLPTYIARPEGEGRVLIVYITDIFGWTLPNSRLLADRYAKKGGYLVYVPDFMNGHGAPAIALRITSALLAPSSLLTTIFLKPIYLIAGILCFIPTMLFLREAASKRLIVDFIKALRTDPATADCKIGVAGFCWGGKFAVLLAHDDPDSRVQPLGSPGSKALIDVAYTAHPSGLKVPGDIEKVKVPLSIAVGEKDMAVKPPVVQEIKSILEKKDVEHEVVVYPGAKHGFATRVDPTDVVQLEAADKAEDQALAWFKRWIG